MRASNDRLNESWSVRDKDLQMWCSSSTELATAQPSGPTAP